MTKVMVFGTFDNIHEGHKYFLKQAKEQGDELIIVIAKDANVAKIKGKDTLKDESQRKKDLENLNTASKVLIGYLDDPYRRIEEESPDIICLGYDQETYTERLKDRFPEINIKRISSHLPEKYKSSIINKKKLH